MRIFVIILFFSILPLLITPIFSQNDSRNLMQEYCEKNWENDLDECSYFIVNGTFVKPSIDVPQGNFSTSSKLDEENNLSLDNPDEIINNAEDFFSDSIMITESIGYDNFVILVVISLGLLAAVIIGIAKTKSRTFRKKKNSDIYASIPPSIMTKSWTLNTDIQNTVTIGISFKDDHLISTMHTGGLHEIRDGYKEGSYFMKFIQTHEDPDIRKMFVEKCLPLEIWNRYRDYYILNTIASTKEEANLFFEKSCKYFEIQLKEKKLLF